MEAAPEYPTVEHARAAQAVVDFFSKSPDVAAVLLTCSCARGTASPDSCLDFTVLLQPTTTLHRQAKLGAQMGGFPRAGGELCEDGQGR